MTWSYNLWGLQYCASDGTVWERCDEVVIPTQCAAIDYWYSPAAQACCVDNGFCCQDVWDLDGDDNVIEELGDCIDIVCE